MEELIKDMLFIEKGASPYARDNKTLKETIDDYYKEFLGDDAYAEDLDAFDKARDIFDIKLGLLRRFIMIKKIKKGNDYEILIKYIREAVDEFEEAYNKRGK